MDMGQFFIGTSGFSYNHWREVFYPQDLPQAKWFAYYCQHFPTVELNVSFYRLPQKETFATWRKIAGERFVFSIKGSRFITHIKRLKNCQKEVERFFEAANGLNLNKKITNYQLLITNYSNLVLWQLAPKFKADPERLKNFLKILPKNYRYAFEFRHQTWLSSEIFQLLKESKAAVVFQDNPGWPIASDATADFIYLRFHGVTGLYSSCYSKKDLSRWAKKIRLWLNKGLDVYGYFNNDAMGYAIDNASELKELVGL